MKITNGGNSFRRAIGKEETGERNSKKNLKRKKEGQQQQQWHFGEGKTSTPFSVMLSGKTKQKNVFTFLPQTIGN